MDACTFFSVVNGSERIQESTTSRIFISLGLLRSSEAAVEGTDASTSHRCTVDLLTFNMCAVFLILDMYTKYFSSGVERVSS